VRWLLEHCVVCYQQIRNQEGGGDSGLLRGGIDVDVDIDVGRGLSIAVGTVVGLGILNFPLPTDSRLGKRIWKLFRGGIGVDVNAGICHGRWNNGGLFHIGFSVVNRFMIRKEEDLEIVTEEGLTLPQRFVMAVGKVVGFSC